MVAVLTRVFGWNNADLVEDVVQESFVKALHVWRFGMPENPQAWLMRTARNAAIDTLRRNKFQLQLPDEQSELLRSEYLLEHTINNLFLDHEVEDSVLRMMFACCSPLLSDKDKIALTLKACAGFSVDEVARALILSPEAAKKRLQRAKKKLAESAEHKSMFTDQIPTGDELAQRLAPVLHVVYLVFNEGYSNSHRDYATRKDLCLEALRLAIILSRNPNTAGTEATALVALLALLAARFEQRVDEKGNVQPLNQQDRSKINSELVAIGLAYLSRSIEGGSTSVYQIEASITYEHIKAESLDTTDWKTIAGLYEQLMVLKPTAIVGLNHAVAVQHHRGANAALEHFRAIDDVTSLCAKHHLFAATLANMYAELGETQLAVDNYRVAIELTPFESERKLFERRIMNLAGC